MERVATGIPGFDDIVQGGLPPDAGIIVQGPPGREKMVFALAFLAEGLRNGGSALAVIASQSPDSLLADLSRQGVDIERVVAEDRLRIVDWFSWGEEAITGVEEDGVIVRSAMDLNAASSAVSRAIVALRGEGQRRAFVEMLSPAVNVFDVGHVYAFAQSTKRKLERFHFTALFLLENEMHSTSVLTTLHQPFDGVIEMERSRSGDRVVRKIGILHLKETTPPPGFLPFEFTDREVRIGSPASPTVSPERAAASPLAAEPGPSDLRRPAQLRATRIGMLQEIARERLEIDPEDRDALFTLAAAQANAEEPRAAVRTLERLEILDPNYPGLWAFEMKLYAQLGETEKWQRSRQKTLEAAEDAAGEGAEPCPYCKARVAPGSAQCPHCMADLQEESDLVRGLEDLVRATVQEMVQEDTGAGQPEADRSVSSQAPQSPPGRKTASKAKGLTNGLVLERRSGRPASAAKSGRVNGLRGRTNGLADGSRGRTNGLTNGLGHTNGLTNGLRGRTNGLTNGLGRTNGLTNGLGRTNGLTNGVGRTNGLTNGLSKVATSRGFFGGGGRSRIQRLGLVAALVILVILLPLALFWTGPTTTYPIQIDGQFGDWAGVAKVSVPPAPVAPNPDIAITRVAVADNLDFLSFYLEVSGNATTGGPAPGRVTNAFYAFIDTDGSPATGYRVQGVGADRMIRIYTWGGRVISASVMMFNTSRAPDDWNAWTPLGSVDAAGSGRQLEFESPWIDLAVSPRTVEVAFASRSWDGQSDAANVVATNAHEYLLVTQDTSAPATVTGTSTDLARFSLTAVGGPLTVGSINVTFRGTFGASSISAVDLVDASGTVLSERAAAAVVQFSTPGLSVAKDQTRTLTVRPKVASSDGTTIGAFLARVSDVAVTSGGVALAAPVSSPESLAYVGAAPSGPAVDGGFGEWANASSAPVGNVQPIWDRDIDLTAYALRGYRGEAYVTAKVLGTVLNGTMVPANNPSYVPVSGNGSSAGGTSPPPPPVDGSDHVRFFLDTDGNVATGLQIGGIGADYMVELAGKDGRILLAAAFRFNGSSPSTGNWVSLGSVPAANTHSQLEAAFPGIALSNASRIYVELTGWNGAIDSSSPAAPISVMSVSTAPGLNPYAPATDPGRMTALASTQQWFFTNTVIGAGAPSDCAVTLKALSTAGSAPGNVNITGGGTVCWYTPTQITLPSPGTVSFSLDLTAGSGSYTVYVIHCMKNSCAGGGANETLGSATSSTYGADTTVSVTITAPTGTWGNADFLEFRITKAAGGTTMTVAVNGPSGGVSDSSATVPIPEFGSVAIPLLGTVLLVLSLVRARARRARARCG